MQSRTRLVGCGKAWEDLERGSWASQRIWDVPVLLLAAVGTQGALSEPMDRRALLPEGPDSASRGNPALLSEQGCLGAASRTSWLGDGACPSWESSVLGAGVCECSQGASCMHRRPHVWGVSKVCTCYTCVRVCLCSRVPLPSPLGRDSEMNLQILPTSMCSCSLPWKCRYLYEKIWKRLQSLLSDLQNHPANWALTPSPARWPFSNTLAVQTGFYSWILLLLQGSLVKRRIQSVLWEGSRGGGAGAGPSRGGEGQRQRPRGFRVVIEL